jgi:hypothetical protein
MPVHRRYGEALSRRGNFKQRLVAEPAESEYTSAAFELV